MDTEESKRNDLAAVRRSVQKVQELRDAQSPERIVRISGESFAVAAAKRAINEVYGAQPKRAQGRAKRRA